MVKIQRISQFVFYGIDGGDASWAFSVYGIATILGALASGYVSSLLPKGWILGFLYGFRAVWVAAYLFLMPKTVLTAVLFATGLGFTGDATVSPTAGLINEHFSIRQVATLIGILVSLPSGRCILQRLVWRYLIYGNGKLYGNLAD